MDDLPITETLSAHILVVDDEGAIRYSISKTLQRVGYQVSSAGSAEEALNLLANNIFDVVLTDIRMPGLSGVDLLARIKESSPDGVVILMTGYASLSTAVEALRLGAHDYLIKPCSSNDLRQSVGRGVERAQNMHRRRTVLSAIQSNLRELTETNTEAQRAKTPVNGAVVTANGNGNGTGSSITPISSAPTSAPPNVMTIGALTIYPGRYQISINDRMITLTPTEFDLLLYLAAHRGRVVPCMELVREVRGYTVEETEAREVIRPHVSNLRRKLERAGQDPDLILNVRGIGYRLTEGTDNS